MNVVKRFYLCFEGVVMGSDFHRNCPEKSSCQVINNKNIPKTRTHQNVNHLKENIKHNSGEFLKFDYEGVKKVLLVMVSSKL